MFYYLLRNPLHRCHFLNGIIAHRHAVNNNANVLGVSGDWSTLEQAEKMVEAFLNTPFTGEARHQRRIDKITQYEQGK